MTDPNLFSSRETRFNHLSEEERQYFKNLEARKPDDPEFIDGLLVTDWLSERTGTPKKEIYQNLQANLEKVFGEGITRAKAYDYIANFHKEGIDALPLNKAYGDKQAVRNITAGLLKSGAAIPSGLASVSSTVLQDTAASLSMRGHPEWEALTKEAISVSKRPHSQDRQLEIANRLSDLRKEAISQVLSIPSITDNPEYAKLGERLFQLEHPSQPALGDQTTRLSEIEKIKARLKELQAEHDKQLSSLPEHVQKLAQSHLFNIAQDLRKTQRVLRDFKKSRDQYLGVDPEYAETWMGILAQGAGSLPVTIAASATGTIFGPILMGAIMYDDAEEERMEHEGDSYDPSDSLFSNLVTAIPQAALERLGGPEKAIKHLLRAQKITTTTGKLGLSEYAKHVGKSALRSAGEESLTEALQGQWAEEVASWTYNDEIQPHSIDAFNRRFVEASVGGVLGLVAGGMISTTEAAKTRQAYQKVLNKSNLSNEKKAELLEAFIRLQYTSSSGNKSKPRINQQPLTKAEFALLRKYNTNEQITRAAPDEETAHLLIAAANGNRKAQHRYNELIRQRNSVDITGAKIGTLTLKVEEDGTLFLEDENGGILRLYENNPEERALAFLAKTAATLKSGQQTAQPQPDQNATVETSQSPNPEEPPITLRTLAGRLRRSRGSNQATTASTSFIGKLLANTETGITAVVSRNSFGKLLSKSAVKLSVSQQAHHEAVGNIDTLFALATLGLSRAPHRQGDIGKITKLHHFDVPMPFEGKVLWVKILVKEMTDKNLPNPLYNVSAIEVKEKPSATEEFRLSEGPNTEGARLPISRPEGFAEKFSAMAAEVKAGITKADTKDTHQKTGVPQTLEQEVEARYERLKNARRTVEDPMQSQARLNDAQREAQIARKAKQPLKLIDEQGIFSRILEPISEVITRINPQTAQRLRQLEFKLTLANSNDATKLKLPKPQRIKPKKLNKKENEDFKTKLQAHIARLAVQRKKDGHSDRDLTLEEIKEEATAARQKEEAAQQAKLEEQPDQHLDEQEQQDHAESLAADEARLEAQAEANLSASELKTNAAAFLQAYDKLPKEIRFELDLALKNSDTTARDLILNTYGLSESFSAITQTLEALHQRLKAAGFELGYQRNYFPRKVSDPDGLSKALAELGPPPAPEGKSVPDTLTLGAQEIETPFFFYQRILGRLDESTTAYYADSAEALNTYIEEASQLLAYAEFFGKHTIQKQGTDSPQIDFEASIESLISELKEPNTAPLEKSPNPLEESEFTPKPEDLSDAVPQAVTKAPILGDKELETLRSLLLARFTLKAPHKAIRLVRELTILSTLGHIGVTLSQIQDIGISAYTGGAWNTAIDTGKALFGKSNITAKELGLDSKSQTGLYDPSALNKTINRVFKLTGFEYMDKVGKEIIMNAKLRQLFKQAKRGYLDTKAQQVIESTFPPEQRARVIQDLKEGSVTEDIQFLAYSILANYQPINLSEYPRAYLTNPNARLFYTLKTFTLKGLNVYRRESLNLIAKGIKTGEKKLIRQGIMNFLHMSITLAAAGISANYLKDWLYGRPTKLSDTAVESLWRIANMSRWYTYSYRNAQKHLRNGEPVDAAVEGGGLLMSLFGPPIPYLTEPYKDWRNSRKPQRTKLGKPSQYAQKGSESVKLIPVVGQPYYWWFGEGARKSANKRKGHGYVKKQIKPREGF